MNKKFDFEKLKTYVIPVFSLILALALVPMVILPNLKKIAQSSLTINQNEKRLDKLVAKADKLEQYAADKDKIEDNLKFVETVLPINKDVAALVAGVQNLARNSGLAVTSFKIQPGKSATDSASLKKDSTENNSNVQKQSTQAVPKSAKDNLVFNLGLSGQLSSLRTFLSALETGKRILTLSQVKSTISVSNNYNFDLFLNAPYSILPEITTDQASSPLAELTEKNKKMLEDLRSPIFSDVTGQPVKPGPTGPVNPFKGN